MEARLRRVHAPFGPLSDAQWRHLAEHSLVPDLAGGWLTHYDPGIGNAFRAGRVYDTGLWEMWDAIACPVRRPAPSACRPSCKARKTRPSIRRPLGGPLSTTVPLSRLSVGQGIFPCSGRVPRRPHGRRAGGSPIGGFEPPGIDRVPPCARRPYILRSAGLTADDRAAPAAHARPAHPEGDAFHAALQP